MVTERLLRVTASLAVSCKVVEYLSRSYIGFFSDCFDCFEERIKQIKAPLRAPQEVPTQTWHATLTRTDHQNISP